MFGGILLISRSSLQSSKFSDLKEQSSLILSGRTVKLFPDRLKYFALRNQERTIGIDSSDILQCLKKTRFAFEETIELPSSSPSSSLGNHTPSNVKRSNPSGSRKLILGNWSILTPLKEKKLSPIRFIIEDDNSFIGVPSKRISVINFIFPNISGIPSRLEHHERLSFSRDDNIRGGKLLSFLHFQTLKKQSLSKNPIDSWTLVKFWQ